MRLLYIEDDQIDQMALQRLLKKGDIELTVANSLEEATTFTTQNTFDLVLTDMFLGTHQASDVVKAMPGQSVVVLSGVADPRALSELYDMGIKGHMIKPLTMENIPQLFEMAGKKPCQQTVPAEVEKETTRTQLDLTPLQKITRGNAKLQADLIRIFLEVVGAESERMQQGLQAQDWENLSYSLHRIKSNLRMFDLRELLQSTEKLELNCRYKEELDAVQVELPKLLRFLHQSRNEAQSLLSTLAAA